MTEDDWSDAGAVLVGAGLIYGLLYVLQAILDPDWTLGLLGLPALLAAGSMVAGCLILARTGIPKPKDKARDSSRASTQLHDGNR